MLTSTCAGATETEVFFAIAPEGQGDFFLFADESADFAARLAAPACVATMGGGVGSGEGDFLLRGDKSSNSGDQYATSIPM